MDFFDTIASSTDGAWLHLENPRTQAPAYALDSEGSEQKDKPIRLKMIGPDSPEYRKKTRARAARVLKQRAGKTNIKKMSQNQIESLIADGEASEIDQAVDATVGWENITMNGEPFPFTEENAHALYTRYPDILRQAHEFAENTANFFEQG